MTEYTVKFRDGRTETITANAVCLNDNRYVFSLDGKEVAFYMASDVVGMKKDTLPDDEVYRPPMR